MTTTVLAGFAAGFSLFLVFLAFRCVFRVEAGHAAKLTSFGRALPPIYEPGLHFKLPWQVVYSESVMERVLDLSGDEGGTIAVASDGTLLRLDSKLRYRVRENQLNQFMFQLKHPVEHLKGLFVCLVRAEIANFEGRVNSTTPPVGIRTSSYALLRAERRLLNERIQESCQEQVDDRYGVEFNAVDLTGVLPSEELGDALNAVFTAEAEIETRLARAQAVCKQRIIAAERGIAIARVQSDAVETEIVATGDYLRQLAEAGTLKEFLERRRAEVYSESQSIYVRQPS